VIRRSIIGRPHHGITAIGEVISCFHFELNLESSESNENSNKHTEQKENEHVRISIEAVEAMRTLDGAPGKRQHENTPRTTRAARVRKTRPVQNRGRQ